MRPGPPATPMETSNRNDRDARFRVALIVETSNEYARGLLRGIAQYSGEHGPWSLSISEHGPWLSDFHGEGKDTVLPDWLEHWVGDGIIARVESPSLARLIERKGLPTVDVGAFHAIEDLPWVVTDDVAVAQLAFEHLTERGFRHLAFATDGLSRGLAARAEEFGRLAKLASKGFELLEFGDTTKQQLETRIRELPKPLGIMAGYDVVGRRVLDACLNEGIAVPEEVGVVGVDDDKLVCSLTDPPLSSVILNTHRAGFEAAKLLDECMSGNRKPRTVRIPPLGVSARRSSDSLAIEDQDVANAVLYIRNHACNGISVADVLRAVPISRRALEKRFRLLVGRTPHQQIVYERINRIRSLLVTTDLPLAQIAGQTGFRHAEYLTVVFKREVGVSPSVYRDEMLGSAGANPHLED